MRRENNAWLPTVTPDGIYGFFGEYRWLSNFHMSYVFFEGMCFPSSEHAYQAAKTEDIEIRRLFQQLKTAKQAKQFGMAIDVREDWDAIRVHVMHEVLVSKFENVELQAMLAATDGLYLEETNYWNDRFWGVCRGEGQNTLGRLLMEIRQDTLPRPTSVAYPVPVK
jgi:ribA/ribD-fused uncharacterized protein